MPAGLFLLMLQAYFIRLFIFVHLGMLFYVLCYVSRLVRSVLFIAYTFLLIAFFHNYLCCCLKTPTSWFCSHVFFFLCVCGCMWVGVWGCVCVCVFCFVLFVFVQFSFFNYFILGLYYFVSNCILLLTFYQVYFMLKQVGLYRYLPVANCNACLVLFPLPVKLCIAIHLGVLYIFIAFLPLNIKYYTFLYFQICFSIVILLLFCFKKNVQRFVIS